MTEENIVKQDEILKLDIKEIMNLLPHRYPFILVDRVTECVLGKYCKGYKNLTINEERALYWLNNGAQPTDTVKNILSKTGVWAKFKNTKKEGK